MVPSASGAASARLTSRCCSTSERPSNDALSTVTWKWSPPPVRSTHVDRSRRGTPRREARGSCRSPSAMMLTTVARLAFLLSAARSGSSAHSPRPSAGPSTRRSSSRCRASSAARGSTRRRRRTCSASRSSSSAASSRTPRSRTRSSRDPGRLAVRKGAGNVVELGSIAAFGFSPLWVLAAAADASARLARLPRRVRRASSSRAASLPEDSRPGSVDELLAALEGVSGTSARLVDIPPLELAALRHSLADLRRDASSLPTPAELARVFDGLREAARRERASLLEVSVGIGLAFFNSARNVGRQHVLDPYTEDLRPRARRGLRRVRHAASRAATRTPSRGTSTPSRRRSPSAASSGCAGAATSG